MTNEASQNSVAGYLTMPAITTSFGAMSSLKRYKGVKNALKAQNHQGFKALKEALGADTFTNSRTLALAYEQYKPLAKNSAKYANKLAKINKTGKLPLIDRFFNLFRKEKVTKEVIEKRAKEAASALNRADDAIKGVKGAKDVKSALKNVDDVLETTSKLSDVAKTSATAVKTGLRAQAEGFYSYFKSNMKNELGLKYGKLNYFLTFVQFTPKLFKKVIPTFKNEGFKSGMKELGKTAIQMATDLVGYATGGAIGRAIGAVIGTAICPGAGSALGAGIGDMICTMVVGSKATKVVDKILGEDSEGNPIETPVKEKETKKQPQPYKTSYYA